MQIQGFYMHKLEFLLSFIILMALKDTNIYILSDYSFQFKMSTLIVLPSFRNNYFFLRHTCYNFTFVTKGTDIHKYNI